MERETKSTVKGLGASCVIKGIALRESGMQRNMGGGRMILWRSFENMVPPMTFRWEPVSINNEEK